MSKAGIVQEYGEEQVDIWRHNFDAPPPSMTEDHPYYCSVKKNPGYPDDPPKEKFPKFESLKDTTQRVMTYWNDVIVPEIKDGKKILIVAHGNSLRGIVMHLDQMTQPQIMKFNIPMAIPFVYSLDKNLRPVPEGSLQFLGDPETVERAIDEVVYQGKRIVNRETPEVRT